MTTVPAPRSAAPSGPSTAAAPAVNLAALSDLVTPWAIRVAATLRLADLLREGHRELRALARAARADPDALRRLLRYLVERGIFAEPRRDTFALTPAAELLADGGPFGLRAWFDLEGMGGRMDQAFSGLLHSVRSGEPAYPLIHGRPLWQDTLDDPELARSYAALMAKHTEWSAPEVVDGHAWPSAGHVVDVGGGSGALLACLLQRRTGLRGTLVDLPRAALEAEARFERLALAERAQVVAGSFFDALPPAADRYLLSWVLHDWGDADALRILCRAAEAARARPVESGRIVIVEHLVTPDRRGDLATAMDLRLLVLFGGRERTPPQLDALVLRAGLHVAERQVTASGIHVVTCVPARDAPPIEPPSTDRGSVSP